jgi:2-C-methyl-D-erythritol 2,4-cyclodiphosphate synthase
LVIRIGNGYDVHRLTTERKLILGGVDIPHHMGLQGHSDADVPVHALMDSMLGAAGLGDIGRLFPDNDERYRGISSMALLRTVVVLIKEKGFTLSNADMTIVAQKPRLAPYIPQMRQNIADCAGVKPEVINIKATTEEGLGFTGKEEGIAAYAVCLLEQRSSSYAYL